MDVIISAADMGFTGSLVGSSMEQSSVLLLCEPPHWCRRPNASWMSSSWGYFSHPLSGTPLFISCSSCCNLAGGSSRVLRGTTSTPTCGAGASGNIS
uniref:Uncharacterized protein n=1 Tax=Oncorhynchus kisutch TaxID=8019 RepID=A0A8C7K783_ONCKI